MIDGREDEVVDHVMAINGWTEEQAAAAVAIAMTQWEARLRHEWSSDYSWVSRVHGFSVDALGVARAEASNEELLATARQRADEAEQTLSGILPPAPQNETTLRVEGSCAQGLQPVLPGGREGRFMGLLKSIFRRGASGRQVKRRT